MSLDVGASRGPAAASRAPAREAMVTAAGAPPVPDDGWVVRPRLLSRLDEGTLGLLTLVCAPAGTGKSSLVASWIAAGRATGPVVWVSVDDSGARPGAWWPRVETGLRDAGLLADGSAGPERPVVLVLDCDRPLGKADGRALEDLLQRCAGELHLVLIARGDPVLPLHRYRLAGAIVELRHADLAFTVDESRQLLEARGVLLSRSTTAYVTERTRGWAAGLLMLAMFLASRADQETAAREFKGDAGTVAEYLVGEVLDAHSRPARALLLSTSVVQVLRPDLVAALAGAQAPRALRFLAHNNAFLEQVPGSPGGYRYHPLFRELLRAQLAYESPALATRLHRVAAEWLAAEGLLAEAVPHAVAAGAWGDAAAYLVDDLAVSRLLAEDSGAAPHAASTLHALPELPPATRGPCGALVLAATAFTRGDLDGCARLTADAGRGLRALRGRRREAAALSHTLLLLATARARNEPGPALAAAESLLEHPGLVEQAAGPENAEVRPVAGALSGGVLLLAGRLDAADQALTAGVVEPSPITPLRPQIDCLSQLAVLSALRWQPRRAEEMARRAKALAASAGRPPYAELARAEAALALSSAQCNDFTTARSRVAAANRHLGADADPVTAGVLALAALRIVGSADSGDASLRRFIAAGQGDDVPPWLASVVRREARRQQPSHASVVMVAAQRTADGRPLEPLTPKEQEVLDLLAGLLTTDEIAAQMFISVNTVRTHVRNILRKLAVSRRNEAVRRAREFHLI